MHLIVGLGNPDGKYLANRHNAGFMALDVIAERYASTPWKSQFQARSCEIRIETETGPQKALLLKPQTYYNESGRSVGEAARYYKIPSPMITVFHDELDLAPGKFRLKVGGGHAGNNGLRSIKAHIDGDFRRGRIGIGHPGDKNRVTGWVLSDFPKADRAWFDDLTDAIARSLPLLIEGNDDGFQTRVTHLAPAPEN